MGFTNLISANERVTKPNGWFVIGIPGEHEDAVNFVFIRTYPESASRIVQGREYYTDYNGNWFIDQARRSIGYNCELTIISYVSNISNNPLTNAAFWPLGLAYVCAMGQNFTYRVNVPMSSSICIGVGNGEQRTFAYGPALEFWESELSNSAATPQGAARLLQIRDALNCSWWEVRYRARITATRTEITHPNGELWNELNGFGKIDVSAAIAWTGPIPPDPFLNGGNVYLPFVP